MIRRDEFEKIVASKLSAEELTPPADMFSLIQSARKKKKKAWWWRKYAALLALLFGAAGLTIWFAHNPESSSETLVQTSNELNVYDNEGVDEEKNAEKTPVTTEILQDFQRNNVTIDGDELHSSEPVAFDEKQAYKTSNLVSSSEDEHVVPAKNEVIVSGEKPKPNDEFEQVELVVAGVQEPQAEEEAAMDTFEDDQMDVLEESQTKQGKEVLPGRKNLSKWAISGSLLVGAQQSNFYGSRDLASLNRHSTQMGFSSGIDLGLRYHLTDVWTVQTGLRMLSAVNKINRQWESRTVEYQVEERTYTIYDPLLPPKTITRIDTIGQSTLVQQNELNGTYEMRCISLPIGINRSWYAQKWGLTAGAGVMLHISERHKGQVLTRPDEIAEVDVKMRQSSVSSTWTALEIHRRLGHQSWVYAGPLLTYDLDKSSVIEGLERRETFFLWNLGLRIGL